MCLAIEGKILSISLTTAQVDFGGIKRDVRLDLTPGAKTGDFVLVHAGFALQIVDEKEVMEKRKMILEIM